MFFRGAENWHERASNGRFGLPFWRLKGGGHTKGGNGTDPASSKPLNFTCLGVSTGQNHYYRVWEVRCAHFMCLEGIDPPKPLKK